MKRIKGRKQGGRKKEEEGSRGERTVIEDTIASSTGGKKVIKFARSPTLY